jgi:hypothetical protein
VNSSMILDCERVDVDFLVFCLGACWGFVS